MPNNAVISNITLENYVRKTDERSIANVDRAMNNRPMPNRNALTNKNAFAPKSVCEKY